MSCISWFKALLFITRVPGDIWSRGKKRLSHCEEVKALELFTVSQNKKSVAESQSRSEFDGLCHMTVQVAAIFALMLLYMHNWTFVCAFCLKASVSQSCKTREETREEGGDLPCLSLNSSFICLINLHDGVL